MAEYQVPQFIEVEDKIFGPLTLKQFIFLAGGVGISVPLVLYLHILGVIVALPILALSLALAFYKVNNKSFVDMLEAGFNYFFGSRLYLWKKDSSNSSDVPAAAAPVVVARQKLTLNENKLHDLARSLDIQEQAGQSEPKI